jgi:hypothetical protein
MEIYLESELAQGTLYTCMELSQWNCLKLLMYDNWKIKIKDSDFPKGRYNRF